MDTLAQLQRKIAEAGTLKSVVRTMKAMAASGIGQYETAVAALSDYYQTVANGLTVYLRRQDAGRQASALQKNATPHPACYAIVFGSELGLIGQFNDLLAAYAINDLAGSVLKETWCVGQRMSDRLSVEGLSPVRTFEVPNSVTAITGLVGEILLQIESTLEKDSGATFRLYHNRAGFKTTYVQSGQHLLPLNDAWMESYKKTKWPTKQQPEIVGDTTSTLSVLLGEYIFVSIYKACAESLASEHAARLQAMERAENNINRLQDELKNKYHQLRQNAIDEELFDIVSGFEAQKKTGHLTMNS